MHTKFLTGLCIAGLLVGCASIPATPYWKNPQWVNELALTVRKNIQYPAHGYNLGIAAGSAFIKFVYDNGKLVAPEILTSTGSKPLDQAILAQIPSIHPPLAQGKDTGVPHGFALLVTVYAGTDPSLNPAVRKFFVALHDALHAQVHYPRSAIPFRAFGSVLTSFNYWNGSVLDAEIVGSSGFKTLDNPVLNELRHVKLPPPPASMANKTLHFSVPFVFSAGEIQHQYVATTTATTVSEENGPCADVAFQYRGGNVSNVHLIKSSGNAALDKLALSDVTSKKIPLHLQGSDLSPTNYWIPICAHN